MIIKRPLSCYLSFSFLVIYLVSWSVKETLCSNTVPLVIWPGMGDSCCYHYGAGGFKTIIQRFLPDIYIKMVAFGGTPAQDSYNSFFLDVNTQLKLACQLLSSDSELKDGFNAMGFSQGGQFLRALVQRCGSIKMFNLISIGGQHQGVYGFPNCHGGTNTFCHLFRRFLGLGTYLSFIQDNLVQAQYWHDPYDEESYVLDCVFLPDINQELVFNPLYKERLSNLSNFVLIKFEKDNMVEPKESQWFGFYEKNQAVNTYSLFESKIYKKDLLGLVHLNNNNRLHFISSPDGHLQFSMNWFMEHIFPYINTTYSKIHIPVRNTVQ